MRAPYRSRPGFTLMELLVVVSILTALAALLLPVLATAREAGRRAVCLSNLRQIAQAHLLYLQDWDERFPGWYFGDVTRRPDPAAIQYWPDLLRSHLRSLAVARDPSAVWNRQFPGTRLADYALPTWGPGGAGTPANPYYRWPGPPLALAGVVQPAGTIGVMDGWTTTEWNHVSLLRHGQGVNVSFLDGHARWLSVAEYHRVESDAQGFHWFRYKSADR